LTDGSLKWSQQALAGDAWNVACMMQNNPNCPAENGPDVDFGAGVILVSLPNGRQLLVAGQKNGVVHAFDPDRKGATVWQTRVGRGGIQGGVHFGMAADGARIYVPISDMRDGRDGRPVDGPPRPGLYALDAADGRLLWSQPTPDRCGKLAFCDPGISAAITATPEVVYAGHMDGYFRAYDANSGKVLFDFDSKRDIVGVNGVSGRGGSFGGAGPAVRNGWVVVNSGYGLYFHMPGNLLLAFAVP
jgi:polyvinyl alcohol dehydrogenase (cytochrome)